MTIAIEAIYDGKNFLPVTPPALKPDTRAKIIVTPHETKSASFLNTARSLNLDGPPDWSEKLDEYLYGGKQPDHE